jgi:hypothetical protein
VLLALMAWFPSGSGASFVSTSESTISVVTAASVANWLHLYSQSTDPDGLTGYYLQPGTTAPAAAGKDTGLTVDLGTYSRRSSSTCYRVFTVATPSTLPAGSSATVTVSLSADPATGQQPISAVGFAQIGATTITNPITMNAGQKRQLNLRLTMPSQKGRAYYPSILITVTYTGYTGTYYQYSVPVKVATN